jgi:hypothetical protein
LAALLPLQGSINNASSAAAPDTVGATLGRPAQGGAAETNRAVRKPRVFMRLESNRVTTKQRARVKVVVSPQSTKAGAAQSQSRLFGRVKVVVKRGAKRWVVRAGMASHRRVVKLPKLPRGIYRVHAKFLGNAALDKAKSGTRKLTVVHAGAGGSAGFPNASNTGVPAGTALTAYTGPSTISKANTVIEGKTMGCIKVTAPGVVIRRSKISCRPGYSVVEVSDNGTYSGTPLLLEDVEIDCKNGPGHGVGEAFVTVRRADIHGCENGFDINQSITVEDSYIHDLYNLGGSHLDGIQLAGGHWNGSGYSPAALNVTIRHNTIYGVGFDGSLGTSAIISNPTGDRNILIQDNLLAGGAYTLYCAYEGTATNYRVVGNHFSKRFSSKYGDYGPSDGCSDETLSGNVDHETGRAVRLD